MAKKDFTITNVPSDVLRDLKNISKNQGVSLSTLIKPKLREIRDSYSQDMRKEGRD